MARTKGQMPETALRLIRDLGEADAMAVISSLGGQLVSLHSSGAGTRRRHDLIAHAGQRLTDRLIECYGESEIYVPRLHEREKEERRASIVKQFNEMVASGSAIKYAEAVTALDHGVTSSAVRNIVKRPVPSSQAGSQGGRYEGV